MPRVIVALNEPEAHAEFLVYVKRIAQCLADTSLFPSPNPPVAVLESHIAALDAAQTNVRLGGKGAADDRDAKRSVVRGDLDQERMYVQTLAYALPSAEAIELVERSGFSVKESSAHGKPGLEAKPGEVSGSVNVVARAEKTRATYYWQCSKDQTTWTSVDDTLQADAWFHGLEAGVLYWFRYRARTKDGLGDWSEPVFLRVK